MRTFVLVMLALYALRVCIRLWRLGEDLYPRRIMLDAWEDAWGVVASCCWSGWAIYVLWFAS